jgi:hypothetical protein
MKSIYREMCPVQALNKKIPANKQAGQASLLVGAAPSGHKYNIAG